MLQDGMTAQLTGTAAGSSNRPLFACWSGSGRDSNPRYYRYSLFLAVWEGEARWVGVKMALVVTVVIAV